MGEVVSFDSKQVERYLNETMAGFLADPVESEYQSGFLSAILVVYREALGRDVDDDRLKLLDRQTWSA